MIGNTWNASDFSSYRGTSRETADIEPTPPSRRTPPEPSLAPASAGNNRFSLLSMALPHSAQARCPGNRPVAGLRASGVQCGRRALRRPFFHTAPRNRTAGAVQADDDRRARCGANPGRSGPGHSARTSAGSLRQGSRCNPPARAPGPEACAGHRKGCRYSNDQTVRPGLWVAWSASGRANQPPHDVPPPSRAIRRADRRGFIRPFRRCRGPHGAPIASCARPPA